MLLRILHALLAKAYANAIKAQLALEVKHTKNHINLLEEEAELRDRLQTIAAEKEHELLQAGGAFRAQEHLSAKAHTVSTLLS